MGRAGKKGKKGKKRKRGQEGGTFRVAGGLLFRTREEAKAHFREALGEGDDGDNGDDGDDEGDEGDKGDKWGGGGLARGVRWGVTRGVRRKGTRGMRRGVPGARMSPGNPPPRRRGNLRVATREWGPRGAGS